MEEKKRFGMVKMGIYEAGGTDESAKNITFEQKKQKSFKFICVIQKIVVSLCGFSSAQHMYAHKHI